MSGDYPETITPDRVRELCEQYPDHVSSKLKTLDETREVTVPETLQSRSSSHLNKEELVSLMEWKLMHGKFRPNLRGLIASNEDSVVCETTRSAFELYSDRQPAKERRQVLSKLAELKGVGPATASLLLSVYDAENAPFFSDELFRFVYLTSNGNGWDRKIKYDMKECLDLVERVGQLRQRLNKGSKEPTSALQLEKAAYVLGRKAKEPSSSEPIAASASSIHKPDSAKVKRKRTVDKQEDTQPEKRTSTRSKNRK